MKARFHYVFLCIYMLLYIYDENVTLAFFTMTLTPTKRPIFLLYLNLSHENWKLLTTFFYKAFNENEQQDNVLYVCTYIYVSIRPTTPWPSSQSASPAQLSVILKLQRKGFSNTSIYQCLNVCLYVIFVVLSIWLFFRLFFRFQFSLIVYIHTDKYEWQNFYMYLKCMKHIQTFFYIRYIFLHFHKSIRRSLSFVVSKFWRSLLVSSLSK